MLIPLAPGWTEKTGDCPKYALAYYIPATKTIIYSKKWWIPTFIMNWVKNHERAHSWGIEDCLSRRKTCLMYEDNDTFWGKVKLIPFWLWSRGRFCVICKTYLMGKVIEDSKLIQGVNYE